jgi:hypothetical protein
MPEGKSECRPPQEKPDKKQDKFLVRLAVSLDTSGFQDRYQTSPWGVRLSSRDVPQSPEIVRRA